MRFEKVIPAYRKGKEIRRKCRNEEKVMDLCIVKGIGKYGYVKEGQFWKAVVKALLKADDWEIVKEKKKVKLRDLTKEQLEKWRRTNCIDDKCHDCIFNKVDCIYVAYCLIKDKSLFNDKFLDQEIEVEE